MLSLRRFYRQQRNNVPAEIINPSNGKEIRPRAFLSFARSLAAISIKPPLDPFQDLRMISRHGPYGAA
jgi:hypothetical protein